MPLTSVANSSGAMMVLISRRKIMADQPQVDRGVRPVVSNGRAGGHRHKNPSGERAFVEAVNDQSANGYPAHGEEQSCG